MNDATEAVLYDKAYLAHLRDEHRTAVNIKENVDTNAKCYEIRTAIAYWFDDYYDPSSVRYCAEVWDTCRAVDAGQYDPVGA